MFNCFQQEIDREIILEVLPDLFPHIEKHDPELSKTIMFEVVDLPRNTPGNELEYKVRKYFLFCLSLAFHGIPALPFVHVSLFTIAIYCTRTNNR